MYRVSQTVLLADRLRRLYTVRTIVGRFATPDTLFAGPEQLICTPRSRRAWRRSRGGGCEKRFTTGGYNATTWPKLEWEFVVAPQEDVEYPRTSSDKCKRPLGNVWTTVEPRARHGEAERVYDPNRCEAGEADQGHIMHRASQRRQRIATCCPNPLSSCGAAQIFGADVMPVAAQRRQSAADDARRVPRLAQTQAGRDGQSMSPHSPAANGRRALETRGPGRRFDWSRTALKVLR